MKLNPQDAQLLFLGTAGIGLNFGQIAPQLKDFEAYYTIPPVLAFRAVDEREQEPAPVVGLVAQGTGTPAQVVGFVVEEQ